jgi:Ca2+-binding RTX toxin-like protein
MTRIIYSDLDLTGYLYGDNLDLKVNKAGTKATYTDPVTHHTVVLSGENLKADQAVDDLLSGGHIDKIALQYNYGGPVVTFSDFDAKATDFDDMLSVGNVWDAFPALSKGADLIKGAGKDDYLNGYGGKDRIYGFRGEDTIYGGKNDDVLTGGGASDRFVFRVEDGAGHDRITDFDIEGNNADYLELQINIESVAKTGGGKDTLITLENGATIELDGVTKSEFNDYWLDGIN